MPIQLHIFLSNIAITIVKHQNSSIKKVSWFPVRCWIDHLPLTVHQISDSITVTHFTIVNKKLKSFNISCVIIFLPMIHASLDQGDKIKLLMMIFTDHTLLLSFYGLRKQICIPAAFQSSTHSNPDVTEPVQCSTRWAMRPAGSWSFCVHVYLYLTVLTTQA